MKDEVPSHNHVLYYSDKVTKLQGCHYNIAQLFDPIIATKVISGIHSLAAVPDHRDSDLVDLKSSTTNAMSVIIMQLLSL